MAQILSLEIIECPAVHLKHTVVITIGVPAQKFFGGTMKFCPNHDFLVHNWAAAHRLPTTALTHRALKICSKSTLKHELDNICSFLVQNGYPELILDLRISKKIIRFQ